MRARHVTPNTPIVIYAPAMDGKFRGGFDDDEPRQSEA